MKSADTPDSVHCGYPQRDRHSSGPPVTRAARCHLPANSPCGTTRSKEVALLPWMAYLVLLRVEIARFTPRAPAAAADGPPGLVSVALILTSRWRAVSSYAALCSPDVPPAHPFGSRASGGLAGFTAGIIA